MSHSHTAAAVSSIERSVVSSSWTGGSRFAAWREWDEPRIVEMLEYAAWLERNAATLDPPVELLDTTERSIEETAAAVCEWLTAL